MSHSTYIHGTSPSEQARLAELNRLTNRSFVQFLNPRPDAQVLEVGSGLGLLANEVAACVPLGRVTGIEISAAQLAQAKPAPNVTFQQGDAHTLPFDDAAFDLVYCRYLLEHVGDPQRVLAEMRRVLRPCGQVFVQENNILVNELWPDCPRFSAVWGKFAELQACLGGDALVGKKLFALLRTAGFADIRLSLAPEVHPATSDGFRPWIENLIGNVRSGQSALLARGLATADEIAAAFAEIEAFEQLLDACAYFYWNRAQAVR